MPIYLKIRHVSAYKVIVPKKKKRSPSWNETENTYNALQIGNIMTTVHGSSSISNYDKSAQFEAQLKFKFLV